MSKRGFTLIELVVVIAVIGVLAVTAIPRLLSKNEVNQRGYTDKVVASIQYARKAAVAMRRHVCVSVSGSDLLFQVNTADPDTFTGFPANCGGNALSLPFQDGNCAAGVTNRICAPSGGAVVLSASFTQLIFNPAGQASANATVTVTGGGFSNTTTIVSDSGYVF